MTPHAPAVARQPESRFRSADLDPPFPSSNPDDFPEDPRDDAARGFEVGVLPVTEPPPRVCKWGGSSLADVDVVLAAASRVLELARERPVVVVVSALGDTTDQLLALISKAASRPDEPVDVHEVRRRHVDQIRALLGPEGAGSEDAPSRQRISLQTFGALNEHLEQLTIGLSAVRSRGALKAPVAASAGTSVGASAGAHFLASILPIGERMAAEIFAAACRLQNESGSSAAQVAVEVEMIDPLELIEVDGSLDDGDPVIEGTLDGYRRRSRQVSGLEPGRIWVVPGFCGRGQDGQTRLLGRGGSDTSATLLGAALGADLVEIWSDVDGVFPEDPRRDATLRPFERLSYDEAERLAQAGARVLHGKSMAPVRATGVPVVVRNSFRPEAPGTWIGHEGAGPDGGRSDGWRRQRLQELCAIDSTTGQEHRLREPLERILLDMGARVHWQELDGRGPEARANLLATWGPPRLLLSTHLDTVPPYLPPRAHEDGLCGRGSCDAKGQIVSQLAAIHELLARGEDRVAWLGVVGEETHSDGARAAQRLPEDPALGLQDLRAVVVGEPTEGRPVIGQKGFLHLELRCTGRRAHGADAEHSDPRHGTNALWLLLDWLDALRQLPRTDHAVFGKESWNLGVIAGGDAGNVVAGEARAELVVRTVPGSKFLEQCRASAPGGPSSGAAAAEVAAAEVTVLCDEPASLYGGAELLAECGLDVDQRSIVAFGSDAPHLAALAAGRVLLFGPGSIATAHTDDESLSWRELQDGTAGLVRLCRRLLPQEDRR